LPPLRGQRALVGGRQLPKRTMSPGPRFLAPVPQPRRVAVWLLGRADSVGHRPALVNRPFSPKNFISAVTYARGIFAQNSRHQRGAATRFADADKRPSPMANRACRGIERPGEQTLFYTPRRAPEAERTNSILLCP